MQFYNTLQRRLAPLDPLQEGQVSLYTCGPTVYDDVHIGNWRAFIFDDTLRRVLEVGGYEVRHVMNITDVGHLTSDADEGEDKLIKRARRQGRSAAEVARYYTDVFKSEAAALRILPPNAYRDEAAGDTFARATRFIPAQIDLVGRLLERGHAYVTEQAIYFDVTTINDYGFLSGQRLADKAVGARSAVVTDSAKRHPADFAVWFFTVGHFADHELRWPSPWGGGFPGWHLECSAIIHATLGDPIDIHTGGVDHIGTHHTNELAQTEGAFGHQLASLWLHNEFVLVDGQKMAKSAGNGYRLADLIAKGYQPLAFRLLVLQSHYRSELNFTWTSLEAAQQALLNLYAWADLVHQPSLLPDPDWPPLGQTIDALASALANDLQTPTALAELFGLLDAPLSLPDRQQLLAKLDAWFGLDLAGRPDITDADRRLIDQRQQARASGDWAESDRWRRELAKRGLEIDDTPSGPRWRRQSLASA